MCGRIAPFAAAVESDTAVICPMEKYIDPERFRDIQHRLKIQTRDAVWWKDACLLYFQQFSKQPIPYELERPVHELKDMMEYKLNITNFECPPYGFTK